MTSWNFISHGCETRKFVIAILRGKQGLLCDKSRSKIMFTAHSAQFDLGLHSLQKGHVDALGSARFNPIPDEPILDSLNSAAKV